MYTVAITRKFSPLASDEKRRRKTQNERALLWMKLYSDHKLHQLPGSRQSCYCLGVKLFLSVICSISSLAIYFWHVYYSAISNYGYMMQILSNFHFVLPFLITIQSLLLTGCCCDTTTLPRAAVSKQWNILMRYWTFIWLLNDISLFFWYFFCRTINTLTSLCNSSHVYVWSLHIALQNDVLW